jgi:cytochrome c-type biogenesis protein CcmE
LAVINGISVDYNALLQTQASSMRAGNVVTVRGTMPQAGQVINASVLVIHGR